MRQEDQTQRPYEVLPSPETAIWRYLSLPKLLSLLQTEALFLCRADLLNDAFEGSFSHGSLEDFHVASGDEFPGDLVGLIRWAPTRSFVSCWHVAVEESAALWRIYGPSEGSVAIRTTVGALQSAFPETTETVSGRLINQGIRRVQYIDYRTEHPYLNDLMGPLCFKRRAFAFEDELRVIRQEFPTTAAKDRPDGRAVLMGPPPTERGLKIRVDLGSLLDAVHVAPTSPPWLVEALNDTIRRSGLQLESCCQSTLDELPDFPRWEA